MEKNITKKDSKIKTPVTLAAQYWALNFKILNNKL